MKYVNILIFFLTTLNSIGQNKLSIENILWEEVGGRIEKNSEYGGTYEITNDAKKGYLKIAYTDEGCGCYSETAAAAYRQSDGNYTLLKTEWDGCNYQKKFSANRDINIVLPKNLGLHTFLPDAGEHNDIDLTALFYLEAILPQKGTDTQINLKSIPFGIRVKGDDRLLTFTGYEQQSDGSNYGYHFNLKEAIEKFVDNATYQHIIHNELHKINPTDIKIVSKLFGESQSIKNFDALSTLFQMLENYYKVSSHIKYKSIILGWDRKTARFYIKEKIANDIPRLSFQEFIYQMPFLLEVC